MIDAVGLLPPCAARLKYIIVAINYLTKWDKDKNLANVSVNSTELFILERIIHRHGCPQFPLNYNGTHFTAHVIPRLNELMDVRGVLTTPYHPKSNGTSERVNGTLTNILWKLEADCT